MPRAYARIVADYRRAFRHQVRLPHCRLWRLAHVDAQLRHLAAPRDKAQWFEGSELRGDDVAVFAFRCPLQAAVLRDWSERCGIDWTLPPEEQQRRPSPPPMDHRAFYGPSGHTGFRS
ncbi:MAG: hypothetical protein K2Y40_02575 [Reyranella sp.]|nr:hypothetical protein [Reyranella sp.]